MMHFKRFQHRIHQTRKKYINPRLLISGSVQARRPWMQGFGFATSMMISLDVGPTWARMKSISRYRIMDRGRKQISQARDKWERTALHEALLKHNIRHEYYVGGYGGHDWATWRHLLFYRFLPNLWWN